MTVSARVVADSLNMANGKRLLSFLCTYHRFAHPEVLTHRALSRNSASSRAIPIHKMLGLVISEPALPVYWGENQSGMQADRELPPHKIWLLKKLWKMSSLSQVGFAWLAGKLGAHKQITNRLVEPFAHMTVIISGTEWGNFFNLRASRQAQPEFQLLARRMLEAYVASEPKPLKPGEWHLPFCDKFLPADASLTDQLVVSTARCARTSYLTFDGEYSLESDRKLHNRLVDSGHWSPFEHAARAESEPVHCGNFVGYTQYRKMFFSENRSEFDPHKLLSQWE